MGTLTIGGQSVTVDDNFAKLSPADQQKTVDEIAGQMKATPQAQPQAPAAQQAVPWYTPITSAPGNAVDFAKGLYGAATHPINTMSGIASLGNGAIANIPGVGAVNDFAENHLGFPKRNLTQEGQDQQVASAVGSQIKQNFSSPTAAWNTIATHPIDTLATLAPGLGQLGKVADAAGMARTASLLGNASEVTNPINLVTKPISALGNTRPVQLLGGFTRDMLAVPSGVGGDTLAEAYNAGKTGGQSGELLRANMRGNASQNEVLQDAQDALGKMAADRSTQYRAGMAATQANPTVASYAPIEQAMQDVTDTLFHGNVSTTDTASLGLAKKIGESIDEWKQNYPNPTSYDLDRLKIKIDNLKPNFTQNSGDQGRIVTAMRNAVKDQILQTDPNYAGTMRAYEESKGLQQDVEQALGNGDNKDATLRKLQSVFRNNANTNYGARMNAAQTLQNVGGKPILPQLAGQQLSANMPRGLPKIVASGSLLGTLLHPAVAAATVPYLLGSSPRLMGELAHVAGRASRVAGNAASHLPIGRNDVLRYLLGGRVSTAYGAIPQ